MLIFCHLNSLLQIRHLSDSGRDACKEDCGDEGEVDVPKQSFNCKGPTVGHIKPEIRLKYDLKNEHMQPKALPTIVKEEMKQAILRVKER